MDANSGGAQPKVNHIIVKSALISTPRLGLRNPLSARSACIPGEQQGPSRRNDQGPKLLPPSSRKRCQIRETLTYLRAIEYYSSTPVTYRRAVSAMMAAPMGNTSSLMANVGV